MLAHYSGTAVILRENGKIDIQKKIGNNKRKITIDITDTKVTLETELEIGFRGHDKKVARVDDTTIVNAETDSALFTWWSGFQLALTTFLTGLNPTTLAAQAAILLSYIGANPAPTSYAGKITSGNDKVRTD